jgi:hypothetical protein
LAESAFRFSLLFVHDLFRPAFARRSTNEGSTIYRGFAQAGNRYPTLGSVSCSSRRDFRFWGTPLFRYHRLRENGSAMIRLFSIGASCFALLLAAAAAPAQAADLRVGYGPQVFYPPPALYPPPVEVFCAECIRDAIYADTKLIAHLEANPDVDEAFKGPVILGARADIHHWRKLLGPGVRISAAPCCYWRKRIYVR